MTNYRDILRQYWGYDSFRGIQQEIIESIGAGHDTLGLMPTGGGKSVTFQVPALAMEGTCIVITPLIALMKDQVQHLRQHGIRAAAIYSGMEHNDIIQTLENAVFGAVKLLYVSPERLSSELFRTKLRHIKVSFICVDEAHCISQWGYDFRPSYLEIADIRHDLPGIPVLALTATATPEVIKDIQDKLSLPATPQAFNVFRMSFARANLAYIVRYAPDKTEQLIHILNNVRGTAIVYTRSRQRTKEISDLLNNAGFNATYFHAGLDNVEKDKRQTAWQTDKVRIMVATNAFGMGIDKPNVRVVVHIDCPSSIEAYFQEAGRAGRDGQKAYAVLLYNADDEHKLRKRIADTFPEKDYIRQVYDHLAYFYQIAVDSGYNTVHEFPIDKFCHAFKHFPIQVESALKILDRAGYIEYIEEQDNQARLMFVVERDDLYRLRGNSPEEDRIIDCLLRNYTGLFNSYSYIDEAFIAQETALSKPVVYQQLKGLAQKHIISFIPQKRIPFIRYRQRREDSEHLLFPPHVYDDLRHRYSQRIEAMIAYATTGNQCRSRQLLRYFGETSSKECGQCDVCIERSRQLKTADALRQAETAILSLLSDGQPHPITSLRNITLPIETIDAAIRQLVDEGRVIDDDGLLSRS